MRVFDWICKLAQANKLPPLTPPAQQALKTWIQENVGVWNFNKIAENPILKPLLPSHPNDCAQCVDFCLTRNELSKIPKEWRTISYMAKEAYLNGIDAANSLQLHNSLCAALGRLLEDEKTPSKLAISIYCAISDLLSQGCLDISSSDLTDVEQAAKGDEFQKLFKRFVKKHGLILRIP